MFFFKKLDEISRKLDAILEQLNGSPTIELRMIPWTVSPRGNENQGCCERAIAEVLRRARLGVQSEAITKDEAALDVFTLVNPYGASDKTVRNSLTSSIWNFTNSLSKPRGPEEAELLSFYWFKFYAEHPEYKQDWFVESPSITKVTK